MKNNGSTKILISSEVLSRTYESAIFLGQNKNYEFIYRNDLKISRYYKIYASIIFKILSIKYFYRSKTFRYRLIRTIGIFDLLLDIKDLKISLKRLGLIVLKMLSIIFLLPFALIPRRHISKLNSWMPTGSDLQGIVNGSDVLIFPFTAFEHEQLFLPTLCKRHNVKLVYIADNWDNLSSKTIILDPPDKMFVWGEQSSNHATEIQGFSPDIIEIGSSPRLQVYKNTSNAGVTKKTLGFMGAFMYFDEISIINKICAQLPAQWDILYRPHPWAMSKTDFLRAKLDERVKIDIDDEGNINYGIEATSSFFERVAISTGGLTTMMVESLLANRPCIALAINDHPLNFYSPRIALKSYTHFEGIADLPNLHIVEDITNFGEVFVEASKRKNQKFLSESLKYIVDSSQPATLENIHKAIKCTT